MSRREAILQEMGLTPVWILRTRVAGAAADAELDATASAPASATVPAPVPASEPNATVTVAEESGMPDAGRVELAQVADPAVVAESSQSAHMADQPNTATGTVGRAQARIARIANMGWSELDDAVAGCEACGLCEGRTRTVFGVGDRKASWMFIGEGPGRNEDQQGEPFVGKAGQLLDNMLKAIGVARGDRSYIANIVKCRPTGSDGRDRPPTEEEASQCLPYLQRQIALVQPQILIALGKTAAVGLLGVAPDTAVGALRGKPHSYQGVPLVVTYHPAYLLRTPADKRKVWEDLCLARSIQAGHTA